MAPGNRIEEHAGDGWSYLKRLQNELRNTTVELLPISSLTASESLRVAGEVGPHVEMLADTDAVLPPIVVHRGPMKVVDGMHRLRAASIRGEEHIRAQVFEGTDEDAFLLAVAANVTHGLPLSMVDRVAAAQRIIAGRPQWSDRAVASVVGVSAKKISEIRRGLAETVPQFTNRIGLDGRTRPLSCVEGRERASELIKVNPTASLRQIAKEAGISPATVADVKRRVLRGISPAPAKRRGINTEDRRQRIVIRKSLGLQGKTSLDELHSLFDSLRRDPSLRYNEIGRMVLHLLNYCAVTAREKEKIIENVPPHCRASLADLFLGYADIWRLFAAELTDGKHLVTC
ncbi:ParB/RepB/Spo0J family partition protein [Frankia sp. Cas3]|uniref:ParB/RepB/Spo0J family partition protein n=1 Tax=Frankia sp. Cas3 TaxID=3073926 RepID=UPI002AD5A18B|nr:ParB N-terminal domain-containing protein [Frankia sp. Cas3]